MTYGRPGVYVTERLLPAPIAASNNVSAAGACVAKLAQGPTTVTRVTSWYQFTQLFGGYDAAFPATFGIGAFFKAGGTELYVRRVVHADATAATVTVPDASSGNCVVVSAKNVGAAGNKLRVQFTAGVDATHYNLTVYLEGGAATDYSGNPTIALADDLVVETFPNVVFNNSASSDYVLTVVNGYSNYITLATPTSGKTPALNPLPLASGTDGTAPIASDYVGTNAAVLNEFNNVNRSLVFFAPEIITDLGATNGAVVHDAIISWCATNDGFAVIDTDNGLSVSDALAYATSRGSYSNAAVYYPNVYIVDPVGRNSTSLRLIGPAGPVAGLYLNTDNIYGPFKSPAGLTANIGSAVALERQFSNTDLDTLNSAAKPINAVRDIPGAGVVVMGARTLKQDGTANRYVSMRRSLLYIKRQLTDTTQFALFQNNDENLWSQIRTAISTFLTQYSNQGGLAGQTPAQAFYVRCDSSNNTAATIANGEVHIEVGVALEYPAEFVVITLSQKTAA
jgi:hypothetical protein